MAGIVSEELSLGRRIRVCGMSAELLKIVRDALSSPCDGTSSSPRAIKCAGIWRELKRVISDVELVVRRVAGKNLWQSFEQDKLRGNMSVVVLCLDPLDIDSKQLTCVPKGNPRSEEIFNVLYKYKP
eukprot:TRINITY_DN4147_c0_g1_i1.p2 TRINITY_DN4147_c0_g1~~TRINITY_DN4147_c0_g1_i1.p2  ORF type:complete len:127 (+),score=29.02 TRINITY_DN4147_c0_g1_i1:85-465(+)